VGSAARVGRGDAEAADEGQPGPLAIEFADFQVIVSALDAAPELDAMRRPRA
jgi:hypothetical protein